MTVTLTERRQLLEELSVLSHSDLLTVWRSASADLSSSEFAAWMRDAVPELVDPYAALAADMSAEWYDESAPNSLYHATPADLPDPGQLQSSTEWALGARGDAALSRLAGVTQRAIWNTSRNTILDNSNREPGARWARHAQADACAFCAMVATRSAVYSSKESALRVTGRGQSMTLGERRARAAGNERIKGRFIAGGSGKTRGTQKLGDKYHDHCRCTAVEVRPGGVYEPPDYVEKWESAYVQATKDTPGVGKYGAIDTNAVLANMRAALGTS